MIITNFQNNKKLHHFEYVASIKAQYNAVYRVKRICLTTAIKMGSKGFINEWVFCGECTKMKGINISSDYFHSNHFEYTREWPNDKSVFVLNICNLKYTKILGG